MSEELKRIALLANVLLLGPATVDEARAAAVDALRVKRNKMYRNLHCPVSAEITKKTKGEVFYIDNIKKTQTALVRAGLCDAQEAYRIHLAAGAQIDRLFEHAPIYEEQIVKNDGKGKERALHFYCPFKVDGIERPLVADVRVIKFKYKAESTLYTVSVTTKSHPKQ